MHVLILVPRQDRVTGNWVSAERFQSGLKRLGHRVDILDTQPNPDPALREFLQRQRPDAALLLHAYRSGRPWQIAAAGTGIPSLVMLTGTDANPSLDDPQQEQVIREVLTGAARILHQNPALTEWVKNRLPELTPRLRHIAPGIVLDDHPYDLRRAHRIPAERMLCLCPAGLRPVKGILELLELFDGVQPDVKQLCVGVCGPKLDADYAERVTDALANRPWARYFGRIPHRAMPAAMQQADVILNNSFAEGLPNALVEATVLGVPILARDIPGNRGVVQPEHNGLLYADARQFRDAFRRLNDPQQRRALSRPDPERFSPAREAAALDDALREVVPAKESFD